MAAVTRLLAGSRCLLAGCRSGVSAVQRPLRAAGGWPARLFSSEEKIKVKFVNRDGEVIVAEGKIGDSLLDLVVEKILDIDGFGACEGTLACSTCHLIFEDHIFQQLEPVTDEEMDMLDLAYGLTETFILKTSTEAAHMELSSEQKSGQDWVARSASGPS